MADINLTKKINDSVAISRRHYEIKPREPWELPTNSVEVPSPPTPFQEGPKQPNLLSMLAGPILMIVMYGGMFAYQASQADQGGSSISPIFFMMPLIGAAQPAIAWFNYTSEKKKYQQSLQLREASYRKSLLDLRGQLDALCQQQVQTLDREYPLLARLISTGMGTAHQKRLWWRRSADPDFLTLRMGTGDGRASFDVKPPRFMAPNDPLSPLAVEVAEAYREVRQLPLLLELAKVGSVAVTEKGGDLAYGMVRRLVLDILVNHSPQDVEVALLADSKKAEERWGWLKWAPHTQALNRTNTGQKLAFDADAVDRTMKWIMDEFSARGHYEVGSRRRGAAPSSIVVIMDDSGDIRRTEDVRHLAAEGFEVNIHLIFIGERNLPSKTRARIDCSREGFKYVETFSGDVKGRRMQGASDPASVLDCERVARHLAGLDVSSTGGSGSIPESVRLSEILHPRSLSIETLRSNWEKIRGNDELLQFPIGLRSGRKGLVPAEINLLPPPPEYTGLGAYHTILIGTTGSGKSELMKSMVLAAAHKYSPRLLNFFFMDFKGGAAFNDFRELPHVMGVVTNLGPQLVDRALSSLEAEINRRQNEFANAGVENIWSYNSRYTQDSMPHMMLILDEFSRGMTDFPRLPDMLEKLGRIGRSLGIYMLLGNQTVNAAMDRLLPNVSWRVVMKVNSPDEARPLIKRLPGEKIERVGQGFIYCSQQKEDAVYEFQGAYSGFAIQDPEENVEESFKIFEIEPNGRWNPNPIYTNTRRKGTSSKDAARPREQGLLITTMKDLAQEYEPARPVYLEPLEAEIPLEDVLEDDGIQRAFRDGAWSKDLGHPQLTIPLGYTDSTEECLQDCLRVNFQDQDGHIWLIGGPSSGKTMAIESMLLSLALVNTPEQAWFYILEFGPTARLRYFRDLPHCGAVITGKDPVEMMDRLLRFLEEEMTKRSNRADRGPEIFIVINNFLEFRNTFPDHVDRIAPFINGKVMGIHLIISTNRRVELPNKLAISRKVVLRLSSRDEYSDAIGGRVTLLPTMMAEGRGLWQDGRLLECQIAKPVICLAPQSELLATEDICPKLAKPWDGPMAPRIRMLPQRIPLSEMIEEGTSKGDGVMFPIGISFETMEVIKADLSQDSSRWLVVGPPKSGKTNFLACLACSVLGNPGEKWQVYYFSLRKQAPEVLRDGTVECITGTTQAVERINQLLATLESPEAKTMRFLILFDDMGAIFEPGREGIVAATNTLALQAGSHENVIIAGAGSSEEMRPYQMSSQLLKILKLSRVGIAFSKESGDMEFMAGPILSMQQKKLEITPGRGFWVSGGKSTLVQSPLAERLNHGEKS